MELTPSKTPFKRQSIILSIYVAHVFLLSSTGKMELMEVTSFKTPEKRRQGQLSDFWRTWSNGSSPATPKTSHTTLRRMLTPEATARFDSELEDQRLMAESAEKERRAQAKFRREHSSGMLLDPDDLGRGVKRGWGVGGRPQGKDRVYDGTHKPRALPSLRRDVPAQCKLQIIMDWWKTAKKHEIHCIKKLSREVKQEMVQKWHWPLSRIRSVKAEVHLTLEQQWARKIKENPGKTIKYTAAWGPTECICCVATGYKRFCDKNKKAVPLQGFQENQMLAVRPTESGELRAVEGNEPWSYSTGRDVSLTSGLQEQTGSGDREHHMVVLGSLASEEGEQKYDQQGKNGQAGQDSRGACP